MKRYCPCVSLCHRLDRNTAGLLIFSKNDTSYNELYEAFKNGTITKKYIAYVDNSSFKKDEETLVKYILKDKKTSYSKVFDLNVEKSQKIITSYHVLYKNIPLNYAVLEVFIHTGKTHQIRAQLKAINHPLIGDPKYGKNEVNKKFKVYKQLLFAVHYSFGFKPNTKLYYLNNINIDLDKNYYNNKLGSDIFGKVKKC